MLLALIAGLIVIGTAVLVGALGYLIEKNMDSAEQGPKGKGA